MKRIALTEGNGKWFDADKAELFKEEVYFDGSNYISKATGNQWHHEAIFKTRSGAYILNCYSNFQGSVDTYEEICKLQASRWFAKQAFDEDEIPEDLQEMVESFEMK